MLSILMKVQHDYRLKEVHVLRRRNENLRVEQTAKSEEENDFLDRFWTQAAVQENAIRQQFRDQEHDQIQRRRRAEEARREQVQAEHARRAEMVARAEREAEERARWEMDQSRMADMTLVKKKRAKTKKLINAEKSRRASLDSKSNMPADFDEDSLPPLP